MKIKNYYKEKEYIHYSNCHEDALFLLNNVSNTPKQILSIASALDNSLALLLLNPDKITAIDFNSSQIYLCNLKKCGIKHLSYHEFLILLGIENGDSLAIYYKIREYLDSDTVCYFDTRKYLIDEIKLVNCGRFEYYFSIFKNKILPLIHSKSTIEKFMTAKTQKEQDEFYRKKFNNLRFKLIFKLFFSESVMKRLGRDKDFFKYNNGSLSNMLKSKFEIGISNNLNDQNPYLQLIVFNKFKALPPYLEKENFDIIKSRIDRLEIKKIDLKSQLNSDEKYDFMYLSDVFEYMSEEETQIISKDVYNSLNFGGQVIFFNMMNKRRLTSPLKEMRLNQDKDRAFYYTSCYLYLKEND